MLQITLHQLVEQASKAKIKEWLPFQIICDGEVIARVTSEYDVEHRWVRPPEAKHDVEQAGTSKHDVPQSKDKPLTELPFSKKRQARSNWRS